MDAGCGACCQVLVRRQRMASGALPGEHAVACVLQGSQGKRREDVRPEAGRQDFLLQRRRRSAYGRRFPARQDRRQRSGLDGGSGDVGDVVGQLLMHAGVKR